MTETNAQDSTVPPFDIVGTATRASLRDAVCSVTGVHWTDLLAPGQAERTVSRARAVLAYLLRHHGEQDWSFPDIARVMNRSSHRGVHEMHRRALRVIASNTDEGSYTRKLIADSLCEAITLDIRRGKR